MKLIVDKWILSTLYSNDNDLNDKNSLLNSQQQQQTHVYNPRNQERQQQSNIFNQQRLNANSILNENTQYVQLKQRVDTNKESTSSSFTEPIYIIQEESTKIMNHQEDKLNIAINEWNYLLILYSKYKNDIEESINSIGDGEHENIYYLIDEFTKLSEYLVNQIKLEELESQRVFSSRQQIIDFVNRNLRIRLLKLTQLRQLFNDYELKFYRLAAHQDLQAHFKYLSEKYVDMFDSLKSKLKCKITKFQEYLKNWTSFNENSNKLDSLFIDCSKSTIRDIKFHEKCAQINENLYELKREFSNLTSILDEQTYSKLQNLIIIYALKLKSFEENYELNSGKYSSLKASTKTSTPDSFDGLMKENNREQTLSPQKSKLTNTIRMRRSSDLSHTLNYCDSCKQLNRNHSRTSSDDHNVSFASVRRYQVSTSDKQVATFHDSTTQTDNNLNGKELLLKAYLHDNENQLNNNLLTGTTTTATTRESGMDTYNTEDDDYRENDNSVSLKKKLNKKSSRRSSLNNSKSCIKSNSNESLAKRNSNASNSIKTYYDVSNHVTNYSNSSFASLKDTFSRLISIFFLLFITLGIVVLLFMYFRYIFNPVCCDLRRDYLFINYT